MSDDIDVILSDESITFKDALRILERYLKSLPKYKRNEILNDLHYAFS